MKHITRLTALFLSLLLTLSVTSFAAASTPTFTADADADAVKIGDDVEVTISIQDNPGISCLVFDVKYDNRVFSCEESDVRMDKLLSAGGFSLVVNPDNDGMLRIVVAAANDMSTDGKLFTVTFHAEKAGTSDFALLFEDVVSGMELIAVNTKNASVTVNGDKVPEIQEPEEVPKLPDEVPEESPVVPSEVTFSDVPETHWAYTYVQNAVKNGLFSGIGNGMFGPAMNVTRGMFVTTLYSSAGSPDVELSNFTDVPANAWYAKAVAWASQQGIVSGIGNNKFGPDMPITREQIALILFNYADGVSPGTEAFVRMAYPDAKDIHDWALTAFTWAMNKDLISGKSGNILDPLATATRAEVAVIMQNFVDMSK